MLPEIVITRMTAVEDGKEHSTVVTPAHPVAPTSGHPLHSALHTPSGVVNTGFAHEEQKRKVSISSDAIQADVDKQRKISTGSYRKNILHNGDRQHFVEPGYAHSDQQNPNRLNLEHLHKYAAQSEVSWWYTLCFKCRQKETGPGWEPSFWQSICPYPFCPTYRHMARVFALALLLVLAWGIVYSVVGKDVAPGGQLFDIAMLVLAAHFGGYLFRMMNLPGLVGMLAVGVLFANVGLINIHGPYKYFTAILRRIALVIILTRAGLDLDPGAMRRLFFTTLKLGLVPWCVEAGIIVLCAHFFLNMPWMWALLTGAIEAAVSPAVVVPCLFRLRSKGYGVAKGIPTVVIAVSGIDDAASVAAFGIIQSLMFSEHSLLYNIALGPISVFGGVGFGILWGLLSKFVPEKGDPFVVPLRILMLLGGGLIAVFGSEMIGLEGAGPLGVVAASFVSSWVWSTQGWEIEDNPVQTAFEIFWMVFEPILFSLTGTQIRLDLIPTEIFIVAGSSIAVAAVIRIFSTVLVAIGGSLNTKEKFFVALSWMAKASVQAALCPVALDTLRKLGRDHGIEKSYAEHLLVTCVLSIAMTAPLGAIVITLAGPRMLTKTIPGPPSGWRHSSRPSLRDITVIDEGNESDDIERRGSRGSRGSRNSHPRPPLQPQPQPSPRQTPNVVITQQP
ncbi:sodium/hydrogen exchanger 9B2 isoform X2 [Homalodisca vitripennis]|uniref:sodium/hydrogen exchanger 9B2 isoform X2 n=1 Tax=Homalodisca vitripennis TaxID=197043 RepID=UPI001EEC4461|nr:sodium/hydrogen exchanger 9B2 isoform X2 [Homalodisca vitripennis]